MVPVVKPELLPTLTTFLPIRLLTGDCRSVAWISPISPIPLTVVVTLFVLKSSANGMKAPSARTNVSAEREKPIIKIVLRHYTSELTLYIVTRLPGLVPAKMPYQRSSVMNEVALSTAPK